MSSGQRVAILASGDLASGSGGSTAERVIRDSINGEVGFSIGVVICNNAPGTVGVYPKVEGLNTEFGLRGDDRIDVVHIGPQTHPDGKQPRGQTLSESAAIARLLEERDIDFVSMLGYLRILTGQLIDEWAWKPSYADGFRGGLYHPNARIINNHPSILPFTADTYGHHAHERAVELYRAGKLTHTAMTWHLASNEVDGGPIVREMPLPILPEDDAGSVGDAIQGMEKQYTAAVIDDHLDLRRQHLLS